MKSDTQTVKSEFSPVRSALWPIHGYELKKFLPSLRQDVDKYQDKEMVKNIKLELIIVTAVKLTNGKLNIVKSIAKQ